METSKASVVILCGGKGIRLRPLTKHLPKPLININKKPILQYIINHILKYNFTEFYIATGYKSDKIEKFMSSKFEALEYKIINSGNVEIIYRIREVIKYLKNDFILCYGDTICDMDLFNLEKFHFTDPSTITMATYPIQIPFGVLTLDNNHYAKSFEEKPMLNEVINIGYFYIPKEYFSYFLKYETFVDVLTSLSSNKKIKCFKHDGSHITVNTIAELENANDKVKELFT